MTIQFQKLLAERGYVAALLDLRQRADSVAEDLSVLVSMFDKSASEDFAGASQFVITEAKNSAMRVLDWLRLATTLCAALAAGTTKGDDADPEGSESDDE
jgi:hypothetical protein